MTKITAIKNYYGYSDFSYLITSILTFTTPLRILAICLNADSLKSIKRPRLSKPPLSVTFTTVERLFSKFVTRKIVPKEYLLGAAAVRAFLSNTLPSADFLP